MNRNATQAAEKPSVFSHEEKSLSALLRHYMEIYFLSHGEELPPNGVYQRLMPLLEKPILEMALEATGGNQSRAAKLLGINRNTLSKKITELRIELNKPETL